MSSRASEYNVTAQFKAEFMVKQGLEDIEDNREKELEMQIEYLKYRLSMKDNVQEEKIKEMEIHANHQVKQLGNELVSKINHDMHQEFQSLFIQYEDTKDLCQQ